MFGLVRIIRGLLMLVLFGKVVIDGVVEIVGEKVFVLLFL